MVEYIDSVATAVSQERVIAYNNLSPADRGPYPTISAFYAAVACLNVATALEEAHLAQHDQLVAEYAILAEMSGRMVMKEYEHGPFVPGHNDLASQNILVRFF